MAPLTSGTPVATQAALTANRVAKSSVPSSTTSKPAIRPSALSSLEPRAHALDRHVRIERRQPPGRRLDLDDTHIGGLEQHLALQIGHLDDIGIDQPQMADASGGEVQRRWGAQAARPDDEHLGGLQRLLPGAADLAQDQVAGVALDLIGGKAHPP